MRNLNPTLGKVLYGLLFLMIIPTLLILWAKYTEEIIKYPPIQSTNIGWILILCGGFFMALSMYALKKHGKGLPMNAYPPKKFVAQGTYRIFRHPIYWGFGILMIGFFILTGSASGLWLVSPITLLGIIALVLGYEKIDLKNRFPGKTLKTILDLPEKKENRPTYLARFSAFFWIASTLLVSNFIIATTSGHIPPLLGDPLTVPLSIENQKMALLSSLFIILIPFITIKSNYLREWTLSGLIAISISTFIALLFPAIGAQYLWPSPYQVATVPIFLILLSLIPFFKQSKLQVFFFSLVALILISLQLSITSSAILNLTGSVLVLLISANYFKIWIFLKNRAEIIANSWKEWTFGKVRVINHGFYVGFAAFFGILLAGFLAGAEYAWGILLFTFIVIVFSALWAQIIEGSEKLKRPYGYYGALVGIIFASLAMWAIGLNEWIIIGVISVAMPWVQALGRLRCLINGCCHGAKVEEPNIGIRYYHHRSRVCGISNLKGEWLHPTPLYSILWLFLVGFVLLALWNNQFSPPFIFGLYLILTSLGRFVEEAYRGEVQTPIIRGLHLYQWTAILSLIIGIFLTIIKVDVGIEISAASFGWNSFFSALIGGLFATFAMGIDFPFSNARFSRLV